MFYCGFMFYLNEKNGRQVLNTVIVPFGVREDTNKKIKVSLN